MSRRARANAGGIERLPLTAGSQHEENTVDNLPVRNSLPMATQRMNPRAFAKMFNFLRNGV
jgi:hypothetical protein